MTWQEFKAETMPLAMQLGAEWDAPTWRMYYRAVKDISPQLYAHAITVAAQTRHKMPSAAQLLELAEQRRKEIADAHPYEPCAKCNHIGTVRIGYKESGGCRIPVYGRCECWEQHQKRIADLGITMKPLALPAARATDFTRLGEDDAA